MNDVIEHIIKLDLMPAWLDFDLIVSSMGIYFPIAISCSVVPQRMCKDLVMRASTCTQGL